MSRPAAARGLKVKLGNRDTWNESSDLTKSSTPRTAGSLTLPVLSTNGRASPSPSDKSPSNGFSPYDFDDGIDTEDSGIAPSASPNLPLSSAERA